MSSEAVSTHERPQPRGSLSRSRHFVVSRSAQGRALDWPWLAAMPSHSQRPGLPPAVVICRSGRAAQRPPAGSAAAAPKRLVDCACDIPSLLDPCSRPRALLPCMQAPACKHALCSASCTPHLQHIQAAASKHPQGQASMHACSQAQLLHCYMSAASDRDLSLAGTATSCLSQALRRLEASFCQSSAHLALSLLHRAQRMRLA